MSTLSIKTFVVTFDDYATVTDDATLYDAIQALEDSHKKFFKKIHVHGEQRYKHRAVLVIDKKGNVDGILTQHDMIKSLEPRYNEIGKDSRLSRFGITPSFMHDQMQLFGLWQSPLSRICRKASSIMVKNIMHPITPTLYINDDANLNEAIHQFIMTQSPILLVVNKGKDIIGVIRLTDVFVEICLTIKSCPAS